MHNVKIWVKFVVSSSKLDRLNHARKVRHQYALRFTLLKLVNVPLHVRHVACEKEQLEGIYLPLGGPAAHFLRQHILVLASQLVMIDLFLLIALDRC